MDFGAIATAGTNLIGGIINNASNLGISRENRAWSEEMSNTSHPREVADLRAAGLNPILSGLGGGGAGTPTASNPTLSDPFGPAVSKGYETALAIKDQQNKNEMNEQMIENARADWEMTKSQATATAKSGNLASEQAFNVRETRKGEELKNELMRKTLPAMVKEANARGDWSQVNQFMGAAKSAASTASDIKDLVSPSSYLFPKKLNLDPVNRNIEHKFKGR